MAELADALDLGSSAVKGVQVQVLFPEPSCEVPRLRSGFRQRAQTPAKRLGFKSCSRHQQNTPMSFRGVTLRPLWSRF
jgi:hypothetical protein